MESLMEINNKDKLPLLTNNQERNKLISLFNWLDTKLEITEYNGHSIKRSELQKYVITNYFNNCYYQNIDLVKQILKIYFTFSTKDQNNSYEYQYVRYRDYLIAVDITEDDDD
jgi:hypothetical protein